MKLLFNERRRHAPSVCSVVVAHYNKDQKVLVIDCEAQNHDEDYLKHDAREAFWNENPDERTLKTCSREEAIRWCVKIADEWHAQVAAAALVYTAAPRAIAERQPE